MRDYPDFLIVGNSFCCKTLLYDYMIQHPAIVKNLREETAFWVEHFERGESWYRSNFPTKIYRKIIELATKSKSHVGETVNLYSQEVPERIHKMIGEQKIIVLLRNPIERSYARYLADVRAGLEKRSFEEALDNPRQLSSKLNQLKMNKIEGMEKGSSIYIIGSIYTYDLRRWSQFFPLEKILFLTSEELLEEPLSTTNKALTFLGLKPLSTIEKIGKNFEKDSPSIKFETRDKLRKIFDPYNNELFKQIGKNIDWK